MEKRDAFYYPTPQQKLDAGRESVMKRTEGLLRGLAPGQQIVITRCDRDEECEFSVEFKQSVLGSDE